MIFPLTQVIVFFALVDGDGVAVTDGVGDADALAVGVGKGVGVADGVAEGVGVGVGVGVAITTGAGFGSDDATSRLYPSRNPVRLLNISITTVMLSAMPESS